MQPRIIQRRQIEGWGFSLLLHGILLSAIIPAFRYLPAPVQHSEPFHWNVTLVESPQQAAVVEPTSEASSTNESPQTGETSDRIQATLSRNVPSSVPRETNDVGKTFLASDDGRPTTAVPAATVVAVAKPESVPPIPSMTESTPVIQDPVPLQRDVTEQPRATVASTSIPTEPSTQTVTSVVREALPPPAPSVADVATVPAQSREELQAPIWAPPIASSRPTAARADYSWLQRAVSRRLEELKRSSRPSLGDTARLKVLVKAVVSNRGELMEVEVVNSSGLARIDQEAMMLVQRAFPMTLDESLDRPQIVMRIPITYSRE